MRRWVKWTIGGVVLVLLCFGILAGVSGYMFVRHLSTATAEEAETLKKFDEIRARFGSRAPLIEVINPRAGDVRVNRLEDPQHRTVNTIHILAWQSEGGQRIEADLPLWLMKFSSLNILSRLGVAPERWRLTVADIERYGPGIVVELREPGEKDVLIWVQ